MCARAIGHKLTRAILTMCITIYVHTTLHKIFAMRTNGSGAWDIYINYIYKWIINIYSILSCQKADLLIEFFDNMV